MKSPATNSAVQSAMLISAQTEIPAVDFMAHSELPYSLHSTDR